MFRTKSEVDQYVATSFQKLRAKEKNLRSMQVAKLYLRVQDFDSARNYILTYLSEKEDSALAYKILGNTYEGLGQKTKAIAAYKKSLELEASQPELLSQICQLLCDKDIEFDLSTAQFCLARANSSGFSHHPAVFILQEKLLTNDPNNSQEDYEQLVLSELKTRPTDVSVRVKLIKLLLDAKKINVAYSHVLDIESKQLHFNNPDWYRCSTHVFKVYFEEFPKNCDWEFFLSWLSAIDRLCVSYMSATASNLYDIVTVAESIHTLDQTIHLAAQKVAKAPELYSEFIKHLTGQLAFHLVVLLMKRSKKETSTWRETKKFIGPLLLFAACDPPNTEASWCLAIKGIHRDMLNCWVHQAHCRYFQSGQLLNVLVKENQTDKVFLDKVNYFATNDWRKRVYEKVFLAIDEACSTSSHFVTSEFYSVIPKKLPYINSITPSLFVQSFERNYPSSLHHLTWLGLHSLQNPRSVLHGKISPSLHTMLFKNMQFTVANLNNTGVETLNRLDVDAFLYATILSTGAVLEGQQESGYFPPDRPLLLPADITSPLCTNEQQKWWSSACSISKCGGRSLGNVKMSDLRQNLQRGIEVVRGDGLPLPLQICLARTFAVRGSESESIDESGACKNRAVDMWKIAMRSLERLNSDQCDAKLCSKSTLFEHPIKDIPPGELPQLLDEGRIFLADMHLNKGQLEKALELYSLLRTPQAYFQTASIYLDLARELANGGLRNSQETKAKCAALTSKARKALQVTKEMLQGDLNNSLEFKVKQKYGELDDFASRADEENDVDLDGVGSDGHYSIDSGGEDDSPNAERLITPHNSTRTARNNNKPTASSTPRRLDISRSRHNSGIADILGMQQNSNQLKLQQIMELSKLTLDRMDSIIIEQRTQRSHMEDLSAKFNHLETEFKEVKTTLADIKKELKRPDLYNMLDDDDYQTDDMFHYQSNVAPAVAPQVTSSRTVAAPGNAFFNQRVPQVSEAAAAQLAAAGVQYFSPRVDQMYQNSVNFFNAQGTLPFVDGQSVPDYLRGLNHPPKLPTQLPAVLPPPFGHPIIFNPSLPVSISSGAPRMLPQPTFPSPKISGNQTSATVDVNRGPTNVVITTSDPLPTGTPSAQPTLSVTIPPQHLHQSNDLASAQQFNMNVPGAPRLPNIHYQASHPSETVSSDDDGAEAPASISMAATSQFDKKASLAKICYIPGEESSDVLFEKKLKMSKMVNNVWEDVGNGTVKIFKTKTDQKFWLVMRREKTFDIKAQFLISHDSNPNFKVSDGYCIWEAFDSSKLPGKFYKFSAVFKNKDDTAQFVSAYEGAISSVISLGTPNSIMNAANASTHSSSNNSSSTLQKQSTSFTLAPSKLFSTPESSPLNSSLFSTTQTSVSNAGKTGFSETTPAKTISTSDKTVIGGFTFSSTPKLNVTPDSKPEQQLVEMKKTESPFANFSFKKANDNQEVSFLGPPLGDDSKPIDPKLTNQNKPLFSGTVSFSNSASGAKSENQPLTSSIKLGSSIFTSVGTPVFGNVTTLGDRDSIGVTRSPAPENEEDFIPTHDFKPVIPLPELVKVVSGEENEEVLFAERGKLYRFDKNIKEWRDRGIGIMKILHNCETGVFRLLMRREQVHKVCCSHRLTKELQVSKSKTDANAYCWGANDFSDDTNGTFQQFQIKYGTPEQGVRFEEIFKRAQETIAVQTPSIAENTPETSETPKSDKLPLSSLVDKKRGSWDCSICMVRNGISLFKCAACGTPKPGSSHSPQKNETPKFSFGIPSGGNDSTTPGEFGDGKFKSGSFIQTTSSFSSNMTAPKFSFGIPPATADPAVEKANSQVSKLFETKPSQSSLSAAVSQPEGSWECKSCYSRNAATSSACAACKADRPGTVILSTSQLNSSSPTTFSFGNQIAGATVNKVSIAKADSTFSFSFGGNTKACGTGDTKELGAVDQKLPVFSFGAAGDSFGKSSFQFSMPKVDPKSSEKNESVSDHDVSEHDDHEDNIHFQPVIPLPDIVEAKTGEEEELALYSHRAKVFRYDNEAKEWKERGTGDVKILQHSTTGKKRLLMRREPVMKLCLNHYITSDIELKSQDDRSWFWVATDFALDQPSTEKFAIRFKNKEVASEFYEAFEKAKHLTDAEVAPAVTTSSMTASSKAISDDEVVYVRTITASNELQEKARLLQLPENFYLYMDKPPCPGCPGCDYDDDDALGASNVTSTGSLAHLSSRTFWSTPASQTMTTKPTESKKEAVKSNETQLASVFGGAQPLFGSPASTFSFSDVTYSFGQKPATASTNATIQKISQPMFQQQSFSPSTQSERSIFAGTGANLFSKETPTFGALAASSNPTAVPSFLTTTRKENFMWEGAGSSLFGHLTNIPPSTPAPATESIPEGSTKQGGAVSGETTDDDPEREAAVDFEPVIPLPDIIVLTTGEEDEEVLFDERCKLFRYSVGHDNEKIWKERGVGNMKVLKHKVDNTYRLLMRREQVHKVVVNQRITADLELKPMLNSETSVMWAAANLAQEYTEPQVETLALKCKNKDLLGKFKSLVIEAIDASKSQ